MRTTFILCLALLLSVVTRAQEVSYNFARGSEAYDEGNIDEALYYLNKEIEENPANGDAHYVIAMCLIRNDNAKALTSVNKAIKLLTSDEDLAMAYTLRGDIYMFELHELERAIDDFTKAIAFGSGLNEEFLHRGFAYLCIGQFDLAVKDLQQSIKLDPDNHDAHYFLAEAFSKQERWAEAIEQCDNSIKLNSQVHQPYITRAKAHIALKDYDKAIDDVISSLVKRKTNEAMDLIRGPLAKNAYAQTEAKLKAYVEQDNSDFPRFLIALFYHDNNKYETAISYAKDCVIDADGGIALLLSYGYKSLGDYDNALYYCNRAIDIDPTNYTFLFQKAEIFNAQGKYQDAIATYDACVSHDPVNGEAYYLCGIVKMTSGDLDGAVEDFTMAITLNPDEARFYLRRGQAYAKKGNSKSAEADYKKAIEKDATTQNTWVSCIAFLSLGQKEKAMELVDAIYAEDPDSSNGYFLMSRFYAQAGEYDKSLEFMDKCLAKGYDVSAYSVFFDFNPMRENPQFKELIEKYTKRHPVEKTE